VAESLAGPRPDGITLRGVMGLSKMVATGVLALGVWLAGCGGETEPAGPTAASAGSSATGAGAAGGAAGPASSSSAGPGSGGSGVGGGSAAGTGGGGGGPGCVKSADPGHHELPCEGGIVYDVEIPAACAQMACGLVLDMHGLTMTGDTEDENTGMRALGQANDYIVVQPTAPGTPPSWDQATHAPMVFAFVEELATAAGTDPKRAHAMGFSQGGGMTFRMVCDHADFFASAAPAGAITGCAFSGADTPSEEVDILQVHGRTDAIVDFDGIAVPQRDAALAAWPFDAGVVLEDDGAHKATRWTTSSGTLFEFWEHDYEASSFILKGHCVPGGTDLDGFPFGYSCTDQGTFVFGELAMQFFLAHPKP